MKQTKKWTWKQAKNSVLKVVTNTKEGTIEVFDQKGNLIMRKTGLTPAQIKLIEENFLKVVTNTENQNGSFSKSNKSNYDPMFM